MWKIHYLFVRESTKLDYGRRYKCNEYVYRSTGVFRTNVDERNVGCNIFSVKKTCSIYVKACIEYIFMIYNIAIKRKI